MRASKTYRNSSVIEQQENRFLGGSVNRMAVLGSTQSIITAKKTNPTMGSNIS